MNTTLGTAGNLEAHDHNGSIELIPVGQFDYGMLTPKEAAGLIALLARWLADGLVECQDSPTLSAEQPSQTQHTDGNSTYADGLRMSMDSGPSGLSRRDMDLIEAAERGEIAAGFTRVDVEQLAIYCEFCDESTESGNHAQYAKALRKVLNP